MESGREKKQRVSNPSNALDERGMAASVRMYD